MIVCDEDATDHVKESVYRYYPGLELKYNLTSGSPYILTVSRVRGLTTTISNGLPVASIVCGVAFLYWRPVYTPA